MFLERNDDSDFSVDDLYRTYSKSKPVSRTSHSRRLHRFTPSIHHTPVDAATPTPPLPDVSLSGLEQIDQDDPSITVPRTKSLIMPTPSCSQSPVSTPAILSTPISVDSGTHPVWTPLLHHNRVREEERTPCWTWAQGMLKT